MWWSTSNRDTRLRGGILLPVAALPLLGAFVGRLEFYSCLLFLTVFILFAIKHSCDFISRSYALLLFGGLLWSVVTLLTGSNRGEGVYGVLWQVFSILTACAAHLYFAGDRQFALGSILFALGVVLSLQNYAVLALRRGDGVVRFQAGIPYANALAAVLLLALLAGIDRAVQSTKGRTGFFLTLAGSALIFSAILLTHSRTVWLMTALAVPLYLFCRLGRRGAARRLVWLLLPLGITAVLFILIPPLRVRLFTLFGSVTELNERFAYYYDSLGIIARHPLVGIGTGGWSSRQGEFQSALYAARFVHNAPLQLAVDGGVPALLLGGGVMLYPIVRGVRHVRRDKNLLLPLFSLLVLFGHSLLDFDLSIPGVWLLYLLIGGYVLARTKQKAPAAPARSRRKLAAYIGLFALLPVILSLIISHSFYISGGMRHANQAFTAADAALKTAGKFNPFNADIPYIRAHIAADNGDVDAAESLMRQATLLDKNNPKYYHDLGDIYFKVCNYHESSRNYSAAVTYQPLLQAHYDRLRDSLTLQAAQGDPDAAEQLAALPARIEAAKLRFSYWTHRVAHTEELIQ